VGEGVGELLIDLNISQKLKKLKYDGDLTISIGKSRTETRWKNRELTWQELLQKFSQPVRTQETFKEYRKMSKSQRGDVKDVGGFVGGTLKGGRRTADAVTWRQVLTLDADYAKKDFIEKVKEVCDFAFCIYSTHSHSPDNPRLRLVIILSRPVTPEEYAAVGRMIAAGIDIDVFDDTTFEPHRLMYWPSCSSDGEFIFEYQDKPWLDPDSVLAQYQDWADPLEWTVSSRVERERRKQADKQGDPLTKPGVIGAFCRTYSVEDAIEIFLSDIYAPCGEGRYTYTPGSKAGGLIVYDAGRFVYSHHGTDPISGLLVNSFDLVRIHKFGELDEEAKPRTPTAKLPSFLKMQELCLNDERVKVTLGEDRLASAEIDFSETDKSWLKQLEYKKNGEFANTVTNRVIMLENDPNLQDIYYDDFKDCISAGSGLPWKRSKPGWNRTDEAELIGYFDKVYEIYGSEKLREAVLIAARARARHPVRDYLSSLHWDGVKRIDNLLTDYLEAENSEYVKAVTRKTLVAAVARVHRPGIKFDNMLVLVGPQDIGKSTLFSRLGGAWFSDSLSITDMRDKTAAEKLQGYWIIEVSELAGIKKVDVETLKSFLSRQEDKYRPAYGRVVEDHPRQCIIVGSTNQETGFLRDITGNRRFWPVTVSGGMPGSDPFSLDADTVKQFWAEAVHLYKNGEKLYLEGELKKIAQEKQREALESDEREGMVREYLEMPLPEDWDKRSIWDRRAYIHGTDFGGESKGTIERKTVCTLEIWSELFQKNEADIEKQDSHTINAILRKIEGWEQIEKREKKSNYGRQRVFRKVGQS
jgi:putative DNA primase/helicase